MVVNIPDPERRDAGDSKGEVTVILTSFEATRAALKKASALAMRSGARIALLAVQVVPYPRRLDKPPVPLGFIAGRFAEILRQSPVKSEIRIFLCRDRKKALERVLVPHCLVVLGIRKRWWLSGEKRLARRLRRAGHEVILVQME
jgi:hypothetical protein